MGNPLLAFWKNVFGADDDDRRRVRRATLRVAAALGRAGVGDDLPGPAADAGAADRADRHLRGQRARPDADPGPGRRGPARTGWASSTPSTS